MLRVATPGVGLLHGEVLRYSNPHPLGEAAVRRYSLLVFCSKLQLYSERALHSARVCVRKRKASGFPALQI